MLDCLINLIDKYGICVDVDVQRSISQVSRTVNKPVCFLHKSKMNLNLKVVLVYLYYTRFPLTDTRKAKWDGTNCCSVQVYLRCFVAIHGILQGKS